MNTILIWLLWFLGAQAALTLVQFLLRKRAAKFLPRLGVILLKAALAVGFAFLVMAGPEFLRPAQFALTALYAALLPDAAADLLYSLFNGLRRGERHFGAYRLLSFALGALFFVYGTANMQIVTPETRAYTSPKLQEAHKLVFVSDLHVGGAQPLSVTAGTIRKIAEEKPDFVILGGDITDDYTPKADMEEVYRLFGALGVPVYYIDGNHEVLQYEKYLEAGLPYTQSELLAALEKNGVIPLRDESVEIGPDLLLLGREDEASNRRVGIGAPEDSASERFLLVADHRPDSAAEHAKLGGDLQLSGHTHAGQFFPLRWVYSLDVDAYGDYAYDGLTLHVSAGAAGWRIPFRTEAHCHYDVITLLPEG